MNFYDKEITKAKQLYGSMKILGQTI